MEYIVGIAIEETPDNRATVAAVCCPQYSPRLFGYVNPCCDTIRKSACSCIVFPTKNLTQGIRAAYQRTLEKLVVRHNTLEHLTLQAYLLKSYAMQTEGLPRRLVRGHWCITAAEELLLDWNRHVSHIYP